MASAAAPAHLRVVLADDQTIVREGLVTLLGLLPGIEVVGAAPDGERAVALVAELDPIREDGDKDVVILRFAPVVSPDHGGAK